MLDFLYALILAQTIQKVKQNDIIGIILLDWRKAKLEQELSKIMSDSKEAYLAARKLETAEVELDKAQLVLSIFKETIEDLVCKEDKTHDDYRNIGLETVRVFDLLSVLSDYLIEIGDVLDTDTGVIQWKM